MKKPIRAIAAGFLFVFVGTTLVDVVLHLTGAYPPWGEPMDDALALLASSYRLIIGVAGGWLTALLAPDRPMKHALILGAIGTVIGLIGAAATWGAGLAPTWYPVSLAVLALPECWLGAKLFMLR